MLAPLEGIRILEIANWIAVPAAGALLADMGADVVKVEPPQGDAWREFRLEGINPGSFDRNYGFEVDNRGKRSVTLDLRSPAGAEIAVRLAGWVDVLLTNLTPDRRVRYGLSYDQVSNQNPGLVYLGFTGYGPDGPDRDRLGFDYAAFWARSGIMGLIGEPGAPPPPQRPAMGDHAVSTLLVAGILAALFARSRTGKGQEVTGSLLNTGLWVLSTDLQATLISRRSPERVSRTEVGNPLWNAYQAKDNAWLMLVMIQPDPYWPHLCTALGRPDLIADPRFATIDARKTNNRELIALLDGLFSQETRVEWGRRLDAQGVIWAPVQQLADVIDDPQVHANNYFTTIQDAAGRRFETVDTPLKFSESHVGARGPAPQTGQHTEEVLLEAGYSWADIAHLQGAGAFG